MYVNPYANIQFDYPGEVEKWKHHLDDMSSPETANLSKKDNRMAEQLMQVGHAEFNSRNWNDALNMYSQALCFAEPGTMIEVIEAFLK